MDWWLTRVRSLLPVSDLYGMCVHIRYIDTCETLETDIRNKAQEISHSVCDRQTDTDTASSICARIFLIELLNDRLIPPNDECVIHSWCLRLRVPFCGLSHNLLSIALHWQ